MGFFDFFRPITEIGKELPSFFFSGFGKKDRTKIKDTEEYIEFRKKLYKDLPEIKEILATRKVLMRSIRAFIGTPDSNHKFKELETLVHELMNSIENEREFLEKKFFPHLKSFRFHDMKDDIIPLLQQLREVPQFQGIVKQVLDIGQDLSYNDDKILAVYDQVQHVLGDILDSGDKVSNTAEKINKLLYSDFKNAPAIAQMKRLKKLLEFFFTYLREVGARNGGLFNWILGLAFGIGAVNVEEEFKRKSGFVLPDEMVDQISEEEQQKHDRERYFLKNGTRLFSVFMRIIFLGMFLTILLSLLNIGINPVFFLIPGVYNLIQAPVIFKGIIFMGLTVVATIFGQNFFKKKMEYIHNFDIIREVIKTLNDERYRVEES